uniref:Uncharacterized protein n=1 Tax=Cacopsylla melanoneura TaxID=428564 RepID=A0A8D8R9J2_9HEMI
MYTVYLQALSYIPIVYVHIWVLQYIAKAIIARYPLYSFQRIKRQHSHTREILQFFYWTFLIIFPFLFKKKNKRRKGRIKRGGGRKTESGKRRTYLYIFLNVTFL